MINGCSCAGAPQANGLPGTGSMKYKCLVLDHDDTTVNSTPCIHYPAFVKILEELRPGVTFTQEEFLTKNYEPGLGEFYTKELGFTPAEMHREWVVWRDHVGSIIPPFFPGMADLIRRQKAAGGLVCVVSHSFPEYIRRDYDTAGVPQPDLVYGWDADRAKCKPSPWPLQEIMRITGCGPEELLMVDDLKHGLDMAHACGVKFAACFWSYDIPLIRSHMQERADYCLNTIAELEQLLFPGEDA